MSEHGYGPGVERRPSDAAPEGTPPPPGPVEPAAATTRMACLDPQLNAQEQAFLAALTSTERHRIDGDTLVLIGRSGPVARLVRVQPR